LDGEVHNNPTSEEKDEIRDSRLQELGFKVLRFENQMVFQYLSSVLREIKDNFKPSLIQGKELFWVRPYEPTTTF